MSLKTYMKVLFERFLFHAITMIGKTEAFIANSLIHAAGCLNFTLNLAVNSDC